MESVSLRVANWQKSEVEELCYSSSLKVPPKNDLLNVLESHLENLQYNVKFNTGILSTVAHSITVCIFREYHEPKIGIFIEFEKQPEKITQVTMIDVSYVTLDETSIEDSLTKCAPPKDLQIPSEPLDSGSRAKREEFWSSTCGWQDKTAIIFLTFHIVSRYPPKIVNEEEDLFGPLCTTTGCIYIADYFLNEDCSDIVITCQSVKFPAHKIVLSTRVKYFHTMFTSQMKESLEGVIKMDDLDPATCTELLRFIYQGKVEKLSNFVRDLFIAADKYDMVDLRSLCERHLFNHLQVENALEIYDLSQMHRSPVLCKRAKEMILWNKDKFAADPETLQEFTMKYPDLVFQLFKM